ncbi:MAG: DEAD/DEAH box helicase [Flavobacteriaceae bacterium]|nr:DEAD/DEAH box helicase [Flavobacteriaceae bacterium]
MDVKALEEYIEGSANSTIISRSTDIILINAERNKKGWLFSYKGSSLKSYKIEVYESDGDICSDCTCPYDYGMMCKHEVAAVNYIIRETPENTVVSEVVFSEVSKSSVKRMYLEDGILKDEYIVDLYKRIDDDNHYWSGYFEIIEIGSGKLVTLYGNYPPSTQTFEYDVETNLLKFNCTCKSFKKKGCNHVTLCLRMVINKYGEGVFSPNYLDAKIDGFLKKYDMTRGDDYSKFFEFSFDIDGFKVEEKVKNIVVSMDSIKKSILPVFDKEKEDSIYVPFIEPKMTTTHGVGFCFEISKPYRGEDVCDLIVFNAKKNKKDGSFSSSFKRIDESEMLTYFNFIKEEDKNIMIKGMECSNIVNISNRSPDIENLNYSLSKLKSISELSDKYVFYIKKGKDNFIKKNLTQVSFDTKHPELYFTLKENEDFYTLNPKIRLEDKSYVLGSTKMKVYPHFCLLNDKIYFYKNAYTYMYISKFLNNKEINFQKKYYDKLYNEIVLPLSKHFEVETKIYSKAKNNISADKVSRQLCISDHEGEYVLFKLACKYKEDLVMLGSKEKLLDKNTGGLIDRNEALESDFLDKFKELHPDFVNQEDIFYLTPYQLVENEWLLKASEKLKHIGVEIFGAKELKSFKYNLNKAIVSVSVSSNIDWFDLNITIKYGKEIVSLKDIKKALINKSKYVELSDGSLGLLPEKWLTKLTKYFKYGEVSQKGVKVSNYQFNIIDELYDDLEKAPDFLLDLQKKKQRLQNLNTSISAKQPKNVKATLRPYQMEGFNWLVFLYKNNLGGCLADDMGLGKTLQTICFLSYIKSKDKDIKPHLLVLPTSLIFNWQKEIEKFCPSLKYLVYTGAKRKPLFNKFSQYDIILTTYGSVINDIEKIKEFEFGYIILDESQAIKNPNSKRYKTVKLLKSDNRLALTGTPIENNTFDLYAQMNFLNPGLLGNMTHFKKEFSEPIDKNRDVEASSLLNDMINPFLLRRTKKQVATELPEKTETILYCEMGVEQRKVYDAYKDKFRDYLMDKIDENGVNKSQMYVLEGLTKLRQICNSPELLNDNENYGSSSIKLDLLIENIKSKTANHKILVFSQFTSMLALIKARLEENDLEYEYLDGKTKNRQNNVDNFQNNEDIRVFLISLKAGGTGLNLTAADYVFVVDPWWNPAVESQAIDRCYRIGQTKKVMAYKMICRDTIEEKILNLQESKKQISDSVVKVDNIKKSFNTSQIKDLFS